MDIQEKMWVLYQDEPYYLKEVSNGHCIIVDPDNNSTRVYKNHAHFKPIEIPVFHVGDMVLSKTNYYPDLTGTIVKITQVVDDDYIPYEINGEYWFTPFDMEPINY